MIFKIIQLVVKDLSELDKQVLHRDKMSVCCAISSKSVRIFRTKKLGSKRRRHSSHYKKMTESKFKKLPSAFSFSKSNIYNFVPVK